MRDDMGAVEVTLIVPSQIKSGVKLRSKMVKTYILEYVIVHLTWIFAIEIMINDTKL